MNEKIIGNPIAWKDWSNILPYSKHNSQFKYGVAHNVRSIINSDLSFSNEAGWGLYSLSNGGFYMKPLSDHYFHILGIINSRKETVTADAFGVILSLKSIDGLIFYAESLQEEAYLIEKYCQLKDYACQHVERKKIISCFYETESDFQSLYAS